MLNVQGIFFPRFSIAPIEMIGNAIMFTFTGDNNDDYSVRYSVSFFFVSRDSHSNSALALENYLTPMPIFSFSDQFPCN